MDPKGKDMDQKREMVLRNLQNDPWIDENPDNKTKSLFYEQVFGVGALEQFSYEVNIIVYPIVHELGYLMEKDEVFKLK